MPGGYSIPGMATRPMPQQPPAPSGWAGDILRQNLQQAQQAYQIQQQRQRNSTAPTQPGGLSATATPYQMPAVNTATLGNAAKALPARLPASAAPLPPVPMTQMHARGIDTGADSHQPLAPGTILPSRAAPAQAAPAAAQPTAAPHRFFAQQQRLQQGLPGLQQRLRQAQAAGNVRLAKSLQDRIANNQFNIQKYQELGSQNMAEQLHANRRDPFTQAQIRENWRPGGTNAWYQQRSENAAAGRPLTSGVVSNQPGRILRRTDFERTNTPATALAKRGALRKIAFIPFVARAGAGAATRGAASAAAQGAARGAANPGWWSAAKNFFTQAPAAAPAAAGASKGFWANPFVKHVGVPAVATTGGTLAGWGAGELADRGIAAAGGPADFGFSDTGAMIGGLGGASVSKPLRRMLLGSGGGWAAGETADMAARAMGYDDPGLSDIGMVAGGLARFPGLRTGIAKTLGPTAAKRYHDVVHPLSSMGYKGTGSQLNPANYRWNPFAKGLTIPQRVRIGAGTTATVGGAGALSGAVTGFDPTQPIQSHQRIRQMGVDAGRQYVDQQAQRLGFADSETMLNSPLAKLIKGYNEGNLLGGVAEAWAALTPEQKYKVVALVTAGLTIPAALGALGSGNMAAGAALGAVGAGAGAYAALASGGTVKDKFLALPEEVRGPLAQQLASVGYWDSLRGKTPAEAAQSFDEVLKQLFGEQGPGQALAAAQGQQPQQPAATPAGATGQL